MRQYENDHPGAHVKQYLKEKGVTVTKAAEILGVTRVALSRFLNGRTSLSPQMALRLERAFGIKREALLPRQAEIDRQEMAMREPSITTGAYAPALSQIKARQIASWASQMHARSVLSELLRRLVHSTGRGLTRVNFPAGDNAERPGWDGEVEADMSTPWVPGGKSRWEFSCAKDIKHKADKDYEARSKNASREETFVFVTPHNWAGEKDWAQKRAALGDWKDVRVYDASDLEQWIEQSATTQVWFAEKIDHPHKDYRSVEKFWSQWAEACEPPLSPKLFFPIANEFSEKFQTWLSHPPQRPFTLAADSRDEALALLCCLVRTNNEWKDQTIIFDTLEALQQFSAPISAPLIAVIHRPEVAKELGRFHRHCHCVITLPRNTALENKPDITLQPIGDMDFDNALKDMKLPEKRRNLLARESGRSPTILRRRLAVNPALRTPDWAKNSKAVRNLIPAAMAGAWHQASPADREVLQFLAGTTDKNKVEKDMAELLTLEDPPVWSLDEYRSVTSRVDVLYGVAHLITSQDLEHFLRVAEYVLSEKDPAIDLPEHKRWAAKIYEKVRRHSYALRNGILDTLILLTVHGNDLFYDRLGFNAEEKVSRLVRKLLNSVEPEELFFQLRDLPYYAEAAPETVLSSVEHLVKKSDPIIQEIMKPGEQFALDVPKRAHLLWALECLAWNPEYFHRVVKLLAELCEISLGNLPDKYENKPQNTLNSLFLSWRPQTAAPLADRKKALERLCEKHPRLGWGVCIKQFNPGRSFAIPNYCPRWRNDAVIASRSPAEYEDEHHAFVKTAIDTALNWKNLNENMLGDLVQRIQHLTPQKEKKLWDLIEQWNNQEPDDQAKAKLREWIQIFTGDHETKGAVSHPKRRRMALKNLLPEDSLARNEWLFSSYSIELQDRIRLDHDGLPGNAEAGQTELQDRSRFDYEEWEKKVRTLRLKALHEIWDEHGSDGINKLLQNCAPQVPAITGNLMMEVLKGRHDEAVRLIKSRLHETNHPDEIVGDDFLYGFFRRADSSVTKKMVQKIKQSSESDDLLRLFLSLPFQPETWESLDNEPSEFQHQYWKNIQPGFQPHLQEAEINAAMDRLLEAGNIPAAYNIAHIVWDKVETSRLTKFLDLTGRHLTSYPGIEHYYITKAFTSLEKRSDITGREKARLEFLFLPILDRRSEYRISNIEAQIVESPELYARIIADVFCEDDGKDKSGEQPGEAEQEQKIRLLILLDKIKCIPGRNEHGTIDAAELKEWLTRARAECALLNRAKIGDEWIGQLLSRNPVSDDELWPCPAVCEALEWMASDSVDRGFVTGAFNSDNQEAHWGEEGDRERELAARYREWADKRAHSHPHICRLLREIANNHEKAAGWIKNRHEIYRRTALA